LFLKSTLSHCYTINKDLYLLSIVLDGANIFIVTAL